MEQYLIAERRKEERNDLKLGEQVHPLYDGNIYGKLVNIRYDGFVISYGVKFPGCKRPVFYTNWALITCDEYFWQDFQDKINDRMK